MLGPGDLIFHPHHGFGTISGLTRRDPLHPIEDVVTSEGVSDPGSITMKSSSWMGGRCLCR